MAHPRKLIRHAVRDLLASAATVAGEKVYPTRVVPARGRELPLISVYTLEDDVDPDSVSTAPRELTRELPVVIEAWVQPGDNPDDAMDDIAEEIEKAMHADPFLGGKVADSVLSSTQMEVIDDGARLLGLVVLTYTATYRTLAPEAPTDLEDFRRAGTDYNLGGELDPDDDVSDLVTVQEDP